MENFSIFVSALAKQQLGQHILFLAKVDKDAARNLQKQFIKAFKSLEKFPQRFPYLYDDLIPHAKYRKMPLEKHYLVIYQIKKSTVFIDYLVDCRQNYTWLLH